MNRTLPERNWLAISLTALIIFALVVSQGQPDWSHPQGFDTGLESAKWAVRFLVLSLAMTPLSSYFNWKAGLKLRKSLGLWSFTFAVVHVVVSLEERQPNWLQFPLQPFILLGFAGLAIMSLLALTSNRFAMQRLRKNWKRLHRGVYLASLLILAHAMLATLSSKKIFVKDPEAIEELKIYAFIVAILLILRIPLIRRTIKLAGRPFKSARQPVPTIEWISPSSRPHRPKEGHPEVTPVKPPAIREEEAQAELEF